jgi:hypothetical protein
MALVIGSIPPGFVADNRANSVLIPVPPPNGGAIGWGNVYLSFGADFADAALRVAVYNSGTRSWRITNSLAVPVLGDRASVTLVDGDQKVSVGRVKAGSGDPGNQPIGWMIETTLHA